MKFLDGILHAGYRALNRLSTIEDLREYRNDCLLEKIKEDNCEDHDPEMINYWLKEIDQIDQELARRNRR